MKIEILEGGGAGVEKGMLDIAGLRHHKALDRRCCDRRFGVSRLSRKGCNEWQRGNDIADISVGMRKHPAKREILWQRVASPTSARNAQGNQRNNSQKRSSSPAFTVYFHTTTSRGTLRKMLEKYPRSTRERVRSDALTVLAAFTRYPPSGGIERSEEDFPDEEMSDDALE